MIDQKLLEKIKALIALSNDPNTTIHERNLALQRAQVLMAKYSVGSLDEAIKELPIVHKEFTNIKQPFGTDLMLLNTICTIVGEQFGCYCYMNTQTRKLYIMGLEINCDITMHAVDTLMNQGIADNKTERHGLHAPSGFYVNFWLGFAEGLRDKFIKLSDEKALVLYDKIKDEFRKKVTFIKRIDSGSTGSGMQAGFNSAKNAHMNKGVSKESCQNSQKQIS